MEQYEITGMSCAACSARVEKAVSAVEGVTSCSVSLLTNSMGVEGTATSAQIIEAVKKAGYGATLKGGEAKKADDETLKDRETPVMLRRLFVSLGFLLVLMYVSMGHTMWGWPLPTALEKNPVAIGIVQLVLSAIVMIINQKFFINGTKGLLHRAPNMDTLVALGSSAAFIYSVYALFVMSDAQASGNVEGAFKYLHEFYFESATMILVLITLGKTLEARSKGKTTDALKSLMKLAPKTATLIRDGKEIEVSIEKVQINDLFIVKPGGSIPVDGVLVEGFGAVNESALTGESIPVDKAEGDAVSAATINTSGVLRCRATRVGEDTTLSQIIKMVSDAAATKAPISKAADKVSGIFVPVVMGIALVTFIVWLILGQTVGYALARGISVLVISCPCALGLATPVAIMVGNGMGAKNGILFKNATSLETSGKVNIVALDKTGTITAGQPKVTDIYVAENVSREKLLQVAVDLEQNSEHPLAKALMEKAEELQIKGNAVTEFSALSGNGVTCKIGNSVFYGGSFKFISTVAEGAEKFKTQADGYAEEGKTPLFFCENGKICGIIAVADVIKPDSPQAIKELQNMGIRVVMLTGDNEKTARAIGAQAGVDEVIAGVLPEGKEKVIRELQADGKVAMVGDGINDAPALTRADVGIAIGAGADVAIDAADVVLVKSNLIDVPATIRLSRATLRNIHENLFWAFFYNSLGIPLAAGVFISLLGWELNPMIGAAAMSLSSVCVVTNALRLNFFNIRNSKRDKKIKIKRKENKNMTKTMKIEGMMCGHCSARVKKVLESFPEVEEAVVSHETGLAVITLKSVISDETLKRAVEEQDYTVVSIK